MRSDQAWILMSSGSFVDVFVFVLRGRWQNEVDSVPDEDGGVNFLNQRRNCVMSARPGSTFIRLPVFSSAYHQQLASNGEHSLLHQGNRFNQHCNSLFPLRPYVRSPACPRLIRGSSRILPQPPICRRSRVHGPARTHCHIIRTFPLLHITNYQTGQFVKGLPLWRMFVIALTSVQKVLSHRL